jgi:phosphatidylinositol-4,5-bisphosphate 3-kinase
MDLSFHGKTSSFYGMPGLTLLIMVNSVICRFKIQELFPQMVLILADCPMIYKEREMLCEFYTLLNDWPQLHPDTAIELLDIRFPDRYVRAFAVRHIDKCLDNDQLLIYLLPLVQVSCL